MKKDCWNCKNDNQYAKFPCNYCNTGNIDDFWKPKDEMKDFAIAELEKIEAELQTIPQVHIKTGVMSLDKELVVPLNKVIEKIDNRIKELKGEIE